MEEEDASLFLATEIKVTSVFSKIPNALAHIAQKNFRAKGGCAIMATNEFKVEENMFGVIRKTEHAIVFTLWGMMFVVLYLEPMLTNERLQEEMDGLTSIVEAADVVMGDFNMKLETSGGCSRSKWLAVWLIQRGLKRLESEATFYHHDGSTTTPDQVWVRDKSVWNVVEVKEAGFATDHKVIVLEVSTPWLKKNNNTRVKYQTHYLKHEKDEKTIKFVQESKIMTDQVIPKLEETLKEIKLHGNSKNSKQLKSYSNRANKILVEAIQRVSNITIGRSLNNRPIRVENKEIKNIKKQIRKIRWIMHKRTTRGLPITMEYEMIESLWKQRQTLEQESLKDYDEFRKEISCLNNSDLLILLARIRRAKLNEKGNPLPCSVEKMELHASQLEEIFKCSSEEPNHQVNEKDAIFPSIWKDRLESENLFTVETVEHVLKQVSWKKAPGNNGIEYAHFKAYKGWVKCLTLLLKIVALCGSPDSWKVSITVPIYKKGDPFDINNYRMIGLLQSQRRVFEKVITKEWTRVYHNPLNQSGFRENHSTTLPIIALNRVIKRLQEEKKEFGVVFLDISKAYDTVDRKRLWIKAKKKGITPGLIQMAMDLFEDNATTLFVNGTLSRKIEMQRGLTQGSSLAPLLYTLFISDLLEELNTYQGTKIGLIHLNNMAFADDIAIVGEQTILPTLIKVAENHSNTNKYQFNVGKCKVITNSYLVIDIYGQDIERVHNFNYLGVCMDINGVIETKIVDERIERAQQAFDLWAFLGLRKGGLDKKTRIIALRSFVLSALEYALALLDAKNMRHTKRLDDFTINLFKKTYGLKGQVNQLLLLNLTGQKQFKDIITERQSSLLQTMKRAKYNEIGFHLCIDRPLLQETDCLQRVKECKTSKIKVRTHWTLQSRKKDEWFDLTRWRCFLYLMNRFPGVGVECKECQQKKINHTHYMFCEKMDTLRRVLDSLDEVIYKPNSVEWKELSALKTQPPTKLDVLLFTCEWSDVVVRQRLKIIMEEMAKMHPIAALMTNKRNHTTLPFLKYSLEKKLAKARIVKCGTAQGNIIDMNQVNEFRNELR